MIEMPEPFLRQIRLKRDDVETYEETEHYLLTRDFLVHRESFLRRLVDAD